MKKESGKRTAVIFINSQPMGSDNDGLGEKLLGNFLSTLGDSVQNISPIRLVNSGVKKSSVLVMHI